MLCSVITCYRPENYLLGFIDSYKHSIVGRDEQLPKLHIFSSDDLGKIEDSFIEWKSPSNRFKEINQNVRVHQRHILNYFRCLNYARLNNTDTVIFEDDVKVSSKWLIYLKEALQLLETESCYILTLYSAGAHLVNNVVIPTFFKFNTNSLIDIYPTEHFFGTQGIFFPESIVSELCSYIYEKGIKVYSEPTDLLIKNFCLEHKIPIYVTSYSLVQHLGKATTGLGGFHYATNFVD